MRENLWEGDHLAPGGDNLMAEDQVELVGDYLLVGENFENLMVGESLEEEGRR
jgi:hypothetical protein